ncbi:MAG TPA: hypothetical protein VGO50_15680 [Pyrinomonadaceae bacterium]|nr:hypothetical protein [Pyrinomonadaceae bacterium]
MSDHKSALVPVATSQHQTPELFYRGIKTDTGLFAESLIYYDRVYVQPGSAEQFASFVSTIIQQGLAYEQLIELIESGALKFLDTVTVHPYVSRDPFTDLPNTRAIMNFIPLQEESIQSPNYFESKFLQTAFLRESFNNLSYLNNDAFDKFCSTTKENSLVFDGDVVALGLVDNSYDDILNPRRYKVIVKNILEELYRVNGLDEVPDFEISINEMDFRNLAGIAKNPPQLVIGREFQNKDYKIYEINGKIPLAGLKESANLERIFRTLPLSCAGISNLYIRSAGKLKSDFFLPSPMSQIVGDKLYEIYAAEISRKKMKSQNLISTLKKEVRFPDLRLLINNNQIDFNKILEIRKQGKKFRSWLQQTGAQSDHEVLWNYHNEVAKATGFTRGLRATFKVFGFVAPVITGTAVGIATKHLTDDTVASTVAGLSTLAGVEMAKSIVSKSTEKLFDYGANLGQNWKPVCFGDWTKSKIENLLEK